MEDKLHPMEWVLNLANTLTLSVHLSMDEFLDNFIEEYLLEAQLKKGGGGGGVE